MPLKYKPKSTREEKIEFIRANFPEALKKNPCREFALITQIRNSMLEKGLYSPSYSSSYANIDSAIIKIIQKFQTQTAKNTAVTSTF